METKDQSIGLTVASAESDAGNSGKKRWSAPAFQELDAGQTESGGSPYFMETGAYYPAS